MGDRTLSHLLQSHLLQFDVTGQPAVQPRLHVLHPNGLQGRHGCDVGPVCCNYLARVLTPCPAYLCSLKYLALNGQVTQSTYSLFKKLSCPGAQPSGIPLRTELEKMK